MRPGWLNARAANTLQENESASLPHVSRRFRSLILAYHAVSDAWVHQLAMPTLLMERQLRSLLYRGFRPASAGDTLSGARRLLHVTFDDAYKSVAGALPILERLGLRATVFACAGYADDGRPLDVPELAEEAAAHPEHLATMTWDELRDLAERGVEIGSHTVSHPHLPELSDAELDRELRESRGRCEEELGRPCRFLAYPYGEHDARVQTAVRRAGYAAAFSLRGRTSPTNLYALPRVDLYPRDTLWRATLKTSFVRQPATAVSDLVRRSRRPT